ncbi:bifunctional diguanylate cyclase/phosphodiesterase [Actinotalea sp. M2MS4P-6]|uniref:putative bifunctional diguanylate cyclase/phosphodiesterase n=1 Tax=Actinotalea sp. M2MS4P-6 TaxID=2983762 RepID=UPI0021E36234|nr:bifunctional diguanylate cyclase/phosphodiesterase [Actinotalea sp. M2MS4P-6]MCV2394588.1 bifunctional diguanylate cyclase/phosphodiesterase [Actinotalea sp. M2MS4P-6]
MALQCVVAGAVLGLVVLETGWLSFDGSPRRHRLSSRQLVWVFAWSAALAVVGLVNGLLGLVADPAWTEALLALRFLALASAVVLGLPALQASTGGPSVRGLVSGAAAWYGVATVLWFTTDLVHRPFVAGQLPAYGPLSPAIHLVPLAAIAGYVAAVLRRSRMTPVGGLLAVTGFVSAALLVASSVPPPTAVTELLKGVWALPLVIGLQVMAAERMSALHRVATRRAALRHALAAVANDAWLSTEADALLGRACSEARAALADPTVHGRIRPAGQDRLVTEIVTQVEPDAEARDFLTDLERLVSTAAERYALAERLHRAAFFDLLTGLPSRTALDDHLTDVLCGGQGVALLLVDVEGLKNTNERLGHRAGDELLVQTAHHLSRSLAERVGREVFVARVGGDEFAAVLVGEHSTDWLRETGRELRAEFGAATGSALRTSLTVGIAHATTRDPGTLQRHADRAMAEARRTHAGVAYFDDLLREREADRAAITAELETAVAHGRIIAHFQPVADPATLEVVGLEVLARWQDGDTLRAPASWLPLAEETGLIVEVGKQMFAAARVGMERFGLPVAVNVAARQLDEPDVLRHIEESWGTDAWDRLTIEVTETAIVHDMHHVRAVLAELAARGARIALDDFGTGYNSLARLGRLPLHVLKIDKSLIDDCATDGGLAVLRAVVALAEVHGLEVVAEGVEQRSQLTALARLGVDLVQGNLIGRPQAEPRARASAAPTQRAARIPRAALA